MSETFIPDVRYGTGGNEPLLLDILRPNPPPAAPMPAAIYIHGGGWQSGTRKPPANGLPHRNATLVAHGFFTVSISYRLSTVAKWPAALHDGKAAVRWLRAHTDEYGVDPERIGVWGHSAGGHLAAMLALTWDVPELEGDGGNAGVSSGTQAAVPLAGAYDLSKFRRPDGPTARFLGAPAPTVPEIARAASPLTYVRADAPPLFVVHGEKDEIVPFAQATVFTEAMHATGADATLLPIPGADHLFGTNAFDQKYRTDVNAAALAFFQRHLAPPAL